MGESMSTTELESRRHQFDSRLAAVTERFRTTGVLLPEDEQDVERFRARSDALKRKRRGAKRVPAPASDNSLEAEWQALGQALERWAARIDREYRHG